MAESHKAVLDREQAVKDAKHFKDSLDLLNDLLDYGTNLIPRAFVSSPRDLKDICIIFVQLRQFLAHLDGVVTLATTGNCETATLQLRSLLETAHILEWLLAFDTITKINYLYVANLRQRRQWNSTLVPGTPEAARHAGTVARVKFTPDQLKEVNDEIARIDTILAHPPFDIINAKFESTYPKRNYDLPWYEVYAAPATPKLSIRNISREIVREEEYTYIYSPFSGVSHGSDIWKSIVIGDQNLQVNPIREPQGVPRVVQLAATLTLRVLRILIKEYRAGEEENFKRKYEQEWRSRFFKGYDVKISPRDLTI